MLKAYFHFLLPICFLTSRSYEKYSVSIFQFLFSNDFCYLCFIIIMLIAIFIQIILN